jgi:hypothetical protein
MASPAIGAQTSKIKIVTRIKRLDPGKTFAAKDFLDIASRGMVDVTLAGKARSGQIRRIRRGLYDVPKKNAALGGMLSPDINEAARTLARRYRWKIVPEGAWAANLLGISRQMPARIVYLSDGPATKIQIGRRSIHFKHARPQALSGSAGTAGLVVQALRYAARTPSTAGLSRACAAFCPTPSGAGWCGPPGLEWTGFMKRPEKSRGNPGE